MKRALYMVMALAVMAASVVSAAEVATQDEGTPLYGLDRVESFVYGVPQNGGLLLRLSKVERDLFGMELPGSLTERQQALQNFVEEGNSNQPSFIFKVGVAEWVTLRRVNPSNSFEDRIVNLETTLEGEQQSGALSARLERILTKLLPSGVFAVPVQASAGTVFRAKFIETLTVRNVAQGDVIQLELDEDYVIDGTLAAAKGNRVFASVTRVRLPRSFGRQAEIGVEFTDVEFIGGARAPVLIGPESEKAMKIDKGAIGAAGASIAGLALLGPVGLVGGFLVRGSDKQIPAGATVYVETAEFKEFAGYPSASYSDENPTSESDPAPPAQDDAPPSDVLEPLDY
ncbi:MAG: hypothetical protein LBT08_00180 [Synergistaceae bacterium]|nr:hypothetical protein [Synergistaceae bacterium]